MSIRTCLVCGKAISRLRAGAGGEFCSREHQNQYRLRRSMDQLQEANVMASLLRRREQFKPLASSPVSGGDGGRHLELLPRLASSSPRSPSKPVLRIAARPSALFKVSGLESMNARHEAGLFRLGAPPAEPRVLLIGRQSPHSPLILPHRAVVKIAASRPLPAPRSLTAPASGALLRVSASQRFPVAAIALRLAKQPPLPPPQARRLYPLAAVRPGVTGERRHTAVRFTRQDSPIGYQDREGDTE